MAFPARYSGVCSVCTNPINVGQYISWDRRGAERKTWHLNCADPDAIPAANVSTAPSSAHIPVSGSVNGSDAIIALASAILPLIQADLSGKVDEAKVREIVESELAGMQATKTVIIDTRTDTTVTLDELTHKLFPKLVSLLSADSNVYLYGASGGGKTTAARQAAKALNLPFYMISLNIQSTPSLLMGYKNAGGEYVDTEFYRWYRDGGVFLFDEYDNTSGNLQTALNTALDNGHAAFPIGQVSRHPNAVCIAAGNTVGLGANGTYNSRQLMDGAAQERFEFLGWEYDTELETSAARAANPKHGEIWALWVQLVRAYVAKLSLRLVVSPRASIKGARLLTLGTFTPEEISDLVLFKGIDSDTRGKVLAANPFPKLGA
jgi:cobaltochelatase CobS